MANETCFHSICFYALDPNGPKFFGFAEYLAAMALLVLAWTITDARYQFRVETAPLPLQRIKGAKFLAFCLNVMGLKADRPAIDKDYKALHRALIDWTRRNYESLRTANQEVADACLVDGCPTIQRIGAL